MSGSVNTYDTNSDTFAVSPNLVLGNLYRQYQETLYLRALSSPKEYAETRMKVIQNIKLQVVGDLYANLRCILCEGKTLESDGTKTAFIRFGGTGPVFCPNYPPCAADSMILSIAKSLDSEMDKIVDIVCPPFSNILHNKIETRDISNL